MFLLDPRDKVAKLIYGQLEILDNLVQGDGEGLVVQVGEDVVDAPVLEEVLLRKRKRVYNEANNKTRRNSVAYRK